MVGFLFSICVFVHEVEAILPQVQDVTVSNIGDDTLLDVTFYHTPVTASHYVNEVEVDIDGVITNYQISQDSTTFSAQINLGQIAGNPLVRARVHCTIDGWSSWSNQVTIPEFPSWTILPLFLISGLAVLFYKRKWAVRNHN